MLNFLNRFSKPKAKNIEIVSQDVEEKIELSNTIINNRSNDNFALTSLNTQATSDLPSAFTRNHHLRSITFNVDDFMGKYIEWLVESQNLNRNSFFRAALNDFVNIYKELDLEPFELGHSYNEADVKLSPIKYTVTLSDDLEREFIRLRNIYRQNGLRFNMSHLVRCAVMDRIEFFLSLYESDDE